MCPMSDENLLVVKNDDRTYQISKATILKLKIYIVTRTTTNTLLTEGYPVVYIMAHKKQINNYKVKIQLILLNIKIPTNN